MSDENKVRDPRMGLKAILMGDIGTGKTFSIKTIPDKYEIFLLATEPGFAVIQEDPKLHIAYIPPAPRGWGALRETGEKINTMNNEGLQKLKAVNPEDYRQFLEMIELLNNYTDQRTGEEFGDVCDWDTNRVLVIDSLTGLSKMARRLKVGGKALLTQPDYGAIMGVLELLIDQISLTVRCHVLLLAHVTRERNEIDGSVHIMVSTIGQKLAPTIPDFFDDCVFAERHKKEFTWSTADSDAVTKARHLPIQDNMAPDWGPAFKRWEELSGGKENG